MIIKYFFAVFIFAVLFICGGLTYIVMPAYESWALYLMILPSVIALTILSFLISMHLFTHRE